MSVKFQNNGLILSALVLFMTVITVSAHGGTVTVIDDRSFFDNIPHTLIDFETRGDGTPLLLEPNRFITLQSDEFARQGVRISAIPVPQGSPIIANVGEGQTNVALQEAGSLPNALFIVAADESNYRFDFLEPVYSFGFSVLNSPSFGQVHLSLFDLSDVLLGTVSFASSLVDGTVIGVPYGNEFDWDFGFMGLSVSSDPIAYALVTQGATAIDDLHVGIVPEPPPVTAIGIMTILIVAFARQLNKQKILLCLIFFAWHGPKTEAQINGQVTGMIPANGGPICGSIPPSGCVSPQFVSKPLAGVRVRVIGTSLFAYSQEDGSYALPYSGQSTVAAGWHGQAPRV